MGLKRPCMTGSSPLTRGKLGVGVGDVGDGGLIPAHAGKTHTERTKTHAYRAHPRSRGENFDCALCFVSRAGSSPLTRGKPLSAFRHACHLRLIPAHAGKTATRRRTKSLRRAHPRSRGENGSARSSLRAQAGSSPLTRGKPRALVGCQNRSGLIPAHAGKTVLDQRPRYGRRAHPRSRGENDSGGRFVTPALGSSPLTRGKPNRGAEFLVCGGLIPAHAGKTTPPLTPPVNRLGSSPLTRGKPIPARIYKPIEGLIPAHAGKTYHPGIAQRYSRAHPRSRGENATASVPMRTSRGSSPLTRGKRVAFLTSPYGVGLIPAHAGKTIFSGYCGGVE